MEETFSTICNNHYPFPISEKKMVELAVEYGQQIHTRTSQAILKKAQQ
jgi:hypothetical protein